MNRYSVNTKCIVKNINIYIFRLC